MIELCPEQAAARSSAIGFDKTLVEQNRHNPAVRISKIWGNAEQWIPYGFDRGRLLRAMSRRTRRSTLSSLPMIFETTSVNALTIQSFLTCFSQIIRSHKRDIDSIPPARGARRLNLAPARVRSGFRGRLPWAKADQLD